MLIRERVSEGLARMASDNSTTSRLESRHDLLDGKGLAGQDQRRHGRVAQTTTPQLARSGLAAEASGDHGADATTGVYRRNAVASWTWLRFHLLAKVAEQ
jgi:hypothetical protein